MATVINPSGSLTDKGRTITFNGVILRVILTHIL